MPRLKAREELAELIWKTSRLDESSTISAEGGDVLADALFKAGYRLVPDEPGESIVEAACDSYFESGFGMGAWDIFKARGGEGRVKYARLDMGAALQSVYNILRSELM